MAQVGRYLNKVGTPTSKKVGLIKSNTLTKHNDRKTN